MKMKTKLFALTGVMLSLIAILGIFSLYEMEGINKISSDISDNWLPSCNVANAINTAATVHRMNEVWHVFTTDDKKMAAIEQDLADMQNKINELESKY